MVGPLRGKCLEKQSLGFLNLFFSHKVRKVLIWSRVGEVDGQIGLKSPIRPPSIYLSICLCTQHVLFWELGIQRPQN